MNESIKITIEEQKQIQLEILKRVRQICEENDINYSLGGGTLLGAIRHKGYIPWDDDIDIMLLRKDYEKLLNIFNEKCKESNYKLISFKNQKDYYYPFAKIVDSRTKLIEKSFRNIKDMGIYIDVFPIDFLPNDDNEIKKIYRKYKFKKMLLNLYSIDKKDTITKSKIKLILKKPINWVIEKFKIYRILLKSIDKLCLKYNNTNIVSCVSGSYFEKEIMPSDYISDYVLVDFEGEKYKAPIGYHDYLTKHYGDYMKLPPKDKQVSNHDNEAYWKI